MTENGYTYIWAMPLCVFEIDLWNSLIMLLVSIININ